MTQKPRLALYEYEGEKYLASLVTRKGNAASDSEKQKTRKALAEITALLKQRGHSWPDEGDYASYRGGNNNKATNDNVSRIENFFAWLKKETETMPENEVTQIEALNESDTQGVKASASTTNDIANEPMQATKKKPGRKVLDTVNGEKKSEKLMMYFTPELIGKIRIWCDLKGISAVSYITSLIETDLYSKQDKINAFLEMRYNL